MNNIWKEDFLQLKKHFEKNNANNSGYLKLLENTKKINPEIFEELDYYYNSQEKKIFINFILEKYPPPFKNYKYKLRTSSDIINADALSSLIKRYQPESYNEEDKISIVQYCIYCEIYNKLILIYNNNKKNEIKDSNIKMEYQSENIIRDNEELPEKDTENIKEITLIKKEVTQEEMNELENYIKLVFKPNNSNLTNFIEKSIIVSSILKKYIELEKEKNPSNYIDINEPLNDFDNIYKNLNSFEYKEFWLSLLVKSIQEKNIEIFITKEKDEKLKDIELALFQSFLSLRKYSKYELHFDFGKRKNMEILNEPKNFLEEWKKIISEKLNIDENNFIFTDVRPGSVSVSLAFLNKAIEEVKKMIDGLKEFNEITKIDEKPIIEVIKLNPEILDKAGNRYKGWGINEMRGGEKYLPPLNNWYGIGLKVRDKYDDGNNAWLGYKNQAGEYSIAYLGIDDEIIEDKNSSINITDSISSKSSIDNEIIEDKSSSINITDSLISKSYINDINIRKKSDKNENKFEKEKKEKCGDGICLFQNPDFAENSASFIDVPGYQIKIIFMCRINPKNIRQPLSFKDCWIINPNEIRVYRILIKKIPTSPLTEDINTLKLLIKPDRDYIANLKIKDYSFNKKANEEKFKDINNFRNNKISSDDLFVIRLYSSIYYVFINSYIRNGEVKKQIKTKEKRDEKNRIISESKTFLGFNEAELKSWIRCLQLALSRNKNVDENTVVYRGVKVKFPKNIGIGTKFYLKEFLSTSTEKNFAEDWIKYNGTIMIITLKNNGANGHPNYCYYIEDITYTKNQKEVLISSHCYFTITGIKRGKENELDYINLICEGFLFSD